MQLDSFHGCLVDPRGEGGVWKGLAGSPNLDGSFLEKWFSSFPDGMPRSFSVVGIQHCLRQFVFIASVTRA